MDLQFKTFPFEAKASGPEGSAFEGLVSVFHNIDSYGEIVDDGAFDADLPEFLSDGFIGGLNHDWDNPIGKPQPGTKVTSDGLLLKANVIDTTHGMDVRKMLAAGVVKKLSIGYRVMGDMMLENEDECMAYWEQKGYQPNAMDMARCKGGARVLTRIHLYEGSPVTVPANDLATITAVKAAFAAAKQALQEQTPDTNLPTTEREFEEVLRELGYSRSQAVAITNHGFKSILRDAASDDADTVPDAPSADAEPSGTGTPTTKADDAPDASETLTDGEKSDDGEAIVNPPPSDPAPTETPTDPEEFNPTAEELRKTRERIHRRLLQRQAELDEQIARTTGMFAGV